MIAEPKLNSPTKLADYREGLAARLPESLRSAQRAWRVYRERSDSDTFNALLHWVRILTTTGDVIEAADIAMLARRLEDDLRAFDQGTARAEVIDVLLAQLVECVGALVPVKGASAVTPPAASRVRPSRAKQGGVAQPKQVRVTIVGIEEELSCVITELQQLGYRVNAFESLTAVEAALASFQPDAMLVDIDAVMPGMAEEAARALSGARWGIPTLYISAQVDMQTRLAALRSGGTAFCQKPIAITDVARWLEEASEDPSAEGCRVLLVDDDVVIATLLESDLRAAGMSVCVECNPLDVLDTLAWFKPDVVLMDLYMPGADGMEVTRLIRQMDVYASVPIVFLSSEARTNRKIEAMNLGGDEFLTKPVSVEHLIGAIRSRLARFKTLRALTHRDTLTGLANRRRLDEHLAVEVSRSQRQKRPMTVALIDVDHFKRVNDEYGHATGDRVLRNLAQLLYRGLRKTDLAARFGGEEFCVVLSDTDAITARVVLDRLRDRFAALVHQSGRKTFSATFSCGLADVPTFRSVKAVLEAADSALYQAKRAGRNRSVVVERTAAKDDHP